MFGPPDRLEAAFGFEADPKPTQHPTGGVLHLRGLVRRRRRAAPFRGRRGRSGAAWESQALGVEVRGAAQSSQREEGFSMLR